MHCLGQFLVEQGAITPEQLEDGLRFQRERNQRIGEVAVQRGVLSPEQVEAVRQVQRDDPRLFGDIAVGQRRLTRKTLDELLFFQKIQHTYLGEALLVLGHITGEQYQGLMGRHYALRDEGRVSLRYLQEFYGENRVLEVLVEALERAVRRFAGETLIVASIGGEIPLALFPERALLEGAVLGGRRLAARIGLSEGLAGNLAAALAPGDPVSGRAESWETLLRYFGDMLRDGALLLDQGRVSPDRELEAAPEDCLRLQFRAPSGEAGLAFWLEEAAP